MLYTCYGADGALDRRAHEQQVEACIAAGGHGIALLGIVGEYNGSQAREVLYTMEDWRAMKYGDELEEVDA